MPSINFYVGKKHKGLLQWWDRQEPGTRSEIVVTLLESYIEKGGAGMATIAETLADQQERQITEMKETVERVFEDIPDERRWLKEIRADRSFDVSAAIRRRMKDAVGACPSTMQKEAYYYFRERFPGLAEAAGL